MYAQEVSLAFNSTLYLINMLLALVFTSNYPLCTAFRQLIFIQNVNISFWRFRFGQTLVLLPIFALMIFTMSLEYGVWTVNRRSVQLYLEKEKSQRQEEQQREILQNLPVSVLALDNDNQVIFKN